MLTVMLGVLDREGNARKVVNCSCVVVKNWGEMSSEREVRTTPASSIGPQLLTNDPSDPPQLLPDRAVNWRFASWRGGTPRDGQAVDASRALAITSHVCCWTYAWVDLTDWHKKCLEQALTGFPERGNKQRKRSKTQNLCASYNLCEIVLSCVKCAARPFMPTFVGHDTSPRPASGNWRTQKTKTTP